jgi:lipoate---protein ligase
VKYLNLTFPDPASNLACDEALLELCESSDENGLLRVWEPDNYFVVMGYSNKVASEINAKACEANGVPIFRRFSGGGTVLQGPGCLNYALAVKHEPLGIPAGLTDSYRFVLERHAMFCANQVSEAVQIQGISDLALGGRKFSGNAQHRKRFCSLFHGTFLLGFDLGLIETCLPMPSKQPAYRRSRSHDAFLCNVSMTPHDVRQALQQVWEAEEQLQEIPFGRIEALKRERYSRDEWNLKF